MALRLFDSDGDTSNATLTLNYDTTTTAFNDTATVFEAGINPNGAQNAGTLEAQPIETATGNILANDTGVSSFTNIVSVNGVNPVGGIITINIATGGTVQIYTQTVGAFVAGDYVVDITGRTTQGTNDTIALNYELNNSLSGEVDNATLTINIVDDAPIAENSITEVAAAPLPSYELVIMLDVSGSTILSANGADQRSVDADGNATIRSLNVLALAAMRDLVTRYFAESSNVSIKPLSSALAAIDALAAPGGATNYQAGLNLIQDLFGTIANPNDGVERISYFITDGFPSASVSGTPAGINDPANTTSAGYPVTFTNYVNTNNIQSYGVAVGSSIVNNAPLDGIHNVDGDRSDVEAGAANNGRDLALIVTDINALSRVLTATVPTAFGGNVAGGAGSSVRFGADGGYVQYIDLLLDSSDAGSEPDTIVRFTYNPASGGQVTNNNNAIAGPSVSGSLINLSATQGFTRGSLVFDFATGDYTYFPQGSAAEGDEINIAFGVIDGDGDTATAINTIRFVDGKPQAVDDYDTYLPSTDAAATKFFEGNVINAVGTDGGGAQVSGFRAGVAGEDNAINDADVTSIVFKGTTYNLTVASSGNANGGNFTINANGEFTWTSTTEPANVLIFHRDGYYKYTPPAAQTGDLPEAAQQTVNLTSAANVTTGGLTLSAYSRTANLNNAPDTTVTYSANGAGVTGGSSNARVDNLENLSIRFNAATYAFGVQDVIINLNAGQSDLGPNGGILAAVQYSIYDIAGNLLGQFASTTEAGIVVPRGFSNIGEILIQPNSANATPAIGSITVQSITFNRITVATVTAPDEVIQYTITDKDAVNPDSSTANLTLHVVTNEYAGTAGAETINGSSSNDLISGLAGNDTLNGLAGNDIIRGGAGNDTIDGGADNDQLYGGDGDDTIIGGTGNDYLYGEAGNDNLQGGDGADVLLGGAGNDTINGGAGNDIIVGGTGIDILTGGTGSDIFRWELADRGSKGNPSLDTVTDFSAAAFGAGGDALDLRDILTGENQLSGGGNLASYLHFERLGADTIVHISTNGEYSTGYSPTKDVQRITLTNVDLVQSFADDQAIIADLLSKQKLITD